MAETWVPKLLNDFPILDNQVCVALGGGVLNIHICQLINSMPRASRMFLMVAWLMLTLAWGLLKIPNFRILSGRNRPEIEGQVF